MDQWFLQLHTNNSTEEPTTIKSSLLFEELQLEAVDAGWPNFQVGLRILGEALDYFLRTWAACFDRQWLEFARLRVVFWVKPRVTGNALGAAVEMQVMVVAGKKMEGIEVYESGRRQKRVLQALRV